MMWCGSAACLLFMIVKERERRMQMDDQNKHSVSDLWHMFTAMLYISAFTFGGGFVIATFMKKKFVDEFGWIDEEEMLDLIALAQSSPGAIAVNVAILVGWRVWGFVGMLTAILATILPPMLILSVVSYFYAAFAASRIVALFLKGMQAGVAAILLDVILGLAEKVLKTKSPLHMLIMAAAFVAVAVFDVNVIWIIVAALLIGMASAVILRKEAMAE